jgi:hypothetical protein
VLLTQHHDPSPGALTVMCAEDVPIVQSALRTEADPA